MYAHYKPAVEDLTLRMLKVDFQTPTAVSQTAR